MSTVTTQDVLASDVRKKERLIQVSGGKCCICGYNKCISALEFHHINPEEKEFTVSKNAHIAFDKALVEIRKCILVCANCHREIHAGLIIDIPEPFINEELAQQISQELNEKRIKKHYYCIDCGKEVSGKNVLRCPICDKKNRRVVDRPNRDQLKQEIRIIPFTQLAKKYGVTDKSISKWCKGYNLPSTKTEIKKYSDEEWDNL